MNTTVQPTQCSILKDFTKDASHPVYMDYSATTPVDPRVAEKMILIAFGLWPKITLSINSFDILGGKDYV